MKLNNFTHCRVEGLGEAVSLLESLFIKVDFSHTDLQVRYDIAKYHQSSQYLKSLKHWPSTLWAFAFSPDPIDFIIFILSELT